MELKKTFQARSSVASACALVSLGLSAGCATHPRHPAALGSHSPLPGVSATASPSAPAPGTASPAASVLPHTDGSPSPAANNPTATPTPTYPHHVQGTKEAPVTVKLAAACTTRGSAQTLTVTAPGGYYLSTDAQYSDGNDGRKYGGYYVGKIPASGSYRLPWLVSPKAPMGKVTVWIAVEGGHPTETAFRQPTFVVAKSC